MFQVGRLMIVKDKPDIRDKPDKVDMQDMDFGHFWEHLGLLSIHFQMPCPDKFPLYMKSSFWPTEPSKLACPLDRTLSSSHYNMEKVLLFGGLLEN